MAIQKYVVHPSEGSYTDDKGNPIDSVTVYATSDIIADVGGIATGIPTKQWEHGFLVNQDNFDMYALKVNASTGTKKWEIIE